MNSNLTSCFEFNQSSYKAPNLKAFALGLSIAVLTGCSGGDAPNTSETPQTNTSVSSPKAPTQVKTASKTLTAYERGARVYKKCRTCHTLDEGGRHKVGPNLWAIYDATAGGKQGFAYSKTLKESGIVWTAETMNGYLENPAKYLPGNRMSFIGLRKKEDRDNLQVYLREASSPKN